MRRFTILSLMGLISVVAVSVAALRYPSALWANALSTLAGVSLVASSLIAVLGGRRIFAIGFATCGWLYMALVFTPWLGDQISPRLLTTTVLDLLYDHLVAPETAVVPPPGATGGGPGMRGGMAPGGSSGGGMMGMSMSGMMGGPGMSGPPPSRWETWTAIDRTPSNLWLPNVVITSSPNYLRIGHSLFALACAFSGGLLARSIRRDRQAS